ncbi:hypothetical protein [Gemmatimonas sp.]|uniref:hypothetical protein n=1 Tax=Gemmatimonas sp. TaxID=1962908 RepID=UPI00286B1E9F|nr:hypothetical protein [Gemmatimonas sp.]
MVERPRYVNRSRTALAGIAVVSGLLVACVPAARPLVGSPTRALLPPTNMAAGSQILRFTWTYKDETFEANGDGAVRAQAPDRARLDFFLKNGMAGGYAILLGDSLFVPGVDLVKRLLPPVPLLWSSLGRLALPATPDTTARSDGDTLRVDLGVLRGRDASGADGRAWRLAFGGTSLARVERIEDGKVIEWMSRRRGANGQWQLQYVHERGKRRLAIAVTDTTTVEGFDDAIWRRP